jgi:hypothetical protein
MKIEAEEKFNPITITLEMPERNTGCGMAG